MCKYMDTHTCMHGDSVYVHAEARGHVLCPPLSVSTLLFLKQVLSLKLELTILTRLSDQEAPSSSCIHLQALGLKAHDAKPKDFLPGC